MDTLKILSIGNRFSQDAHKWLHKLAEINGFDIETATWLTTITDKKVKVTEFEDFDVKTLKLIIDTVNTVCDK